MRRRLLAGLALALLASAGSGTAQQATRIEPGARLRVTSAAPEARVWTGEYRALTDSTLVLGGGAPRAIPLSEIGRLEVSRGSRPSVVGGVIGAVLGAGIGGVAGCAVNRDSYGVFCGGQSDTKVAVGAVIGGVVGGAAGALLFRREEWVPARLEWLRPAP